jgi:hypothetical protein
MVAEAPDPPAFARRRPTADRFPWVTVKDRTILAQRINSFFQSCPQANYYSLCRVVAWAKSKRMRRARVFQIVDLARSAWADGMLPELDEPSHDPDLEAQILAALTVENDPAWRRRLRDTQGVGLRRCAYSAWLDTHA